jgi:hypothetical protein
MGRLERSAPRQCSEGWADRSRCHHSTAELKVIGARPFRGAAFFVAAPADWLHFERPAVVAVVVLASHALAICAGVFAAFQTREKAAAERCPDRCVCLGLPKFLGIKGPKIAMRALPVACSPSCPLPLIGGARATRPEVITLAAPECEMLSPIFGVDGLDTWLTVAVVIAWPVSELAPATTTTRRWFVGARHYAPLRSGGENKSGRFAASFHFQGSSTFPRELLTAALDISRKSASSRSNWKPSRFLTSCTVIPMNRILLQ